MSIDSKTVTLLVKLNQLTATEEIKWRAEDPPKAMVRGTDDHIPIFIVCEYKGQRIALFERKCRMFSPEFEEMYWGQQVVMAILDREGRPLWEFAENSSALHDLFETVRRKVSNVDGLLDELLKDEGKT